MSSGVYPNLLNANMSGFSPDILKDGIPWFNRVPTYQPFRFLSLWGASKKKFIVLSTAGGIVTSKTIDNYEHDHIDPNDVWKFIQFTGGYPKTIGMVGEGQYVYIQHVKSGNFMCVPPDYSALQCRPFTDLDATRYVFMPNGNDRSLFFVDPLLQYGCPGKDPQQLNKKQTEPYTCNAIAAYGGAGWIPSGLIMNGYPLAGNPFTPYIRISPDGNIKMSGVTRPEYAQYIATPNLTFDQMPLNDLENEWYPLICSGARYELCSAPISYNFSPGLVRWGTPGSMYSDRFNKCRVPLATRFVDLSTQTKPAQSQFPKVCFTFNNGTSEMLSQGNAMASDFNFEFWQYMDIYTYDQQQQGWQPIELKHLKPSADLGVSDYGPATLYDIMDGVRTSVGGATWGIPPRNIIETAHKNGCKVFGVMPFQQPYYGGRWRWWSDMLLNKEAMAKKFIDFAAWCGVDGWFINFEINDLEGTVPYHDTPGTDCSTMPDQCSHQECQDYWCRQQGGYAGQCNTVSPNNPCIMPLLDINGNDINITHLADFLRECKTYRSSKGVDVQFMMYANLGPTNGNAGSENSFASGVTATLADIWLDPVTKQPLIDAMLSMPGGRTDTTQVAYTYAHSAEAVNGCINGDIKNNYGWPKDTGPSQGQVLSEKLTCGSSSTLSCSVPSRSKQDCGPSDKTTCESTPGCCFNNNVPDGDPWCFKGVPSAGRPICPLNECGPLDPSTALIRSNRSFDWFAGTNVLTTDPLKYRDAWDQEIYCANFPKCSNHIEAIEKPLVSLNIWDLHGTPNGFGIDTYKTSCDFMSVVFTGITGVSKKNLVTDPYTKVEDMGIAHYVPERSVLSSLPFYTSFCLGNGDNFYIDGKVQGTFGSWFDQIQDYLPTWRWWPRQLTTKNSAGRYIESLILSMDYSMAWQGGNCLKVTSSSNMVDTDFHLYKTKFSTNSNLQVKVTYRGDSKNRVSIGYTLGSSGNLVDNPRIHYFALEGSKHAGWITDTFIIAAYPGDYISSICLQAKASDSPYTLHIGDIAIETPSFHTHSPPQVKGIERFKQTATGLCNYNIYWNQIPDVLYYLVYWGEHYIGRVTGSCGPLLDAHPVYFNAQNLADLPYEFGIQAVYTNGKRRGAIYSYSLLRGFLLVVLIGILTYLLYAGKESISNPFLRYGALALMIILCGYCMLKVVKMALAPGLSRGIGNSGLLGCFPAMIENWPECKKKAFNINMDDGRPMAWTWFMNKVKERNYPIKTTFFINTLWLNRDLDLWRKWHHQGNVDFQAHGHFHFSCGADLWHGGSSCDHTIRNKCPGDFGDCAWINVPTPDQVLADNIATCAKQIREHIYKDMSKEMVYAYPYGQYPFYQDDDCKQTGKVKTATMNVIKDNFIAARGVQWGQITDFPDASQPNSLLASCAGDDKGGYTQGLSGFCGGGGDSSCPGNPTINQCDSNYIMNVYEPVISGEIGPEYSWPAGIDWNVDYACPSCTVDMQMDIRYNSMKVSLQSDKPLSIMMWGHDFAPTDKDGKDWPANQGTTLGGSGGDPGINANAQMMAKRTGNDAWLAAKGEYHCDLGIAQEIGSCSTYCSTADSKAPGPHSTKEGFCPTSPDIPNPVKGTPDIPASQACNAWSWNTGNPADMTSYFDCVQERPVGMTDATANSCDQCVEDVFNPAPGSMFLKILDLVKEHEDDLWFAFFIEVVQYLWNRKYTKLQVDHRTANSTVFTLTSTNVMRDIPITVSFGTSAFGHPRVKVDGKCMDVHSTKDKTKCYINFKPKDNSVHTIEVY